MVWMFCRLLDITVWQTIGWCALITNSPLRFGSSPKQGWFALTKQITTSPRRPSWVSPVISAFMNSYIWLNRLLTAVLGFYCCLFALTVRRRLPTWVSTSGIIAWRQKATLSWNLEGFPNGTESNSWCSFFTSFAAVSESVLPQTSNEHAILIKSEYIRCKLHATL